MFRILHVDDEKCEFTLLKHNLKTINTDLDIQWVESGLKALETLENELFDCVISDFQMPEMNGLELLLNIRNRENHIPFIFLTGQGSEKLAAEALRSGADDYFTKDLGFAHYERLIHSLEKLIGHRQDVREKEKLELRAEEQDRNWQMMLNNSPVGFALHKIITDSRGKAVDYTFLEANEQFEEQTGLLRDQIIGKKVTEVIPAISEDDFDWIQAYGKVAIQGEIINTQEYSKNLKKWYQINAYSPKKDYFVVHTLDITERKEAEESLRKSEARFRRIAENAPDIIYRMSLPDGKYEYVSPASEKIVGLSPEELLNDPSIINDTIHPDYHEYFKQEWEKLLAGEMPDHYQYKIIHAKTGEVKWINQRNVLIKDKKGKPRAIEGIVTDFTDKMLQASAVGESEARFKAAFDNSIEDILIWSRDAKLLYANKSARGHLNLGDGELAGIGVDEAFAALPAFAEKWGARLSQVVESGETINFEDRDEYLGRVLLTESTLIPILNMEKTAVTAVCGIHRDVTKRKLIEEDLKKKSNTLNRRVNELHCLYEISRVINDPLLSLDDIFVKAIAIIEKLSSDTEPDTAKIQYDGQEYQSEDFSETPWMLSSQIKVNGSFGMLHLAYHQQPDFFNDPLSNQEEISFINEIADTLGRAVERLIYKEILEHNEAELNAIYENAPLLMFLVDENRKIVKLNSYARQMEHRSKKREHVFSGVEVLRCIHSMDSEKGCGFGPECDGCGIKNNVMRALENDEVFFREETGFDTDTDRGPRRVEVLLSAMKLKLQGKSLVLVCLEDITQQKKLEAELVSALDFAENLLETANVIVVTLDRHARVTKFNRFAENLTGHRKEDVLGKSWFEMFIPAQDQNAIPEVFEKVLENMPEASSNENSILTKDGVSKMISWNNTLLRDGNGRVAGVLSIGVDITAMKKVEQRLEVSNKKLARVNKDLEAFSHTVAHDLKAPLRHIHGFADMLEDAAKSKLDEDDMQLIGEIITAADKAKNQIDDVLRFSRSTSAELHKGKVNLSAIANGIAESLRQEDPQRKVRFKIDKDLSANADEGLISVVLENLLGNAWKFSANVGPAEISFGQKSLKGERVFLVKDNGAGFDPANQDQLFMPFKRLHSSELFKGTGVGLATVERIVTRHGGKVWAESEVGKGATFYFTLGD